MTESTTKTHFFYILQCKDGSFYAGYTIDRERRLQEHNEGIGAKYTKPQKRRPVTMIHTESFATRSEAMKQEYAFKQLNRKQKESYIANAN